LKLTTDEDGEVRITIGNNVITFGVRAGEQLDTGLLEISGELVVLELFSDGRLTDKCTILRVWDIPDHYEGFCCDEIPPVIEAAKQPEPNAKGWNNELVAVSMTAEDEEGGSGIAAIYYIHDGKVIRIGEDALGFAEAGRIATYSFDLAEDGTYELEFWAEDNAGNESEHGSLTVRIDKTKPNVSVSPYSPSIREGETIRLTIEASDSGSGIAYVMADDSTSGKISLSREGDRWTGSLQPTQDGRITIRVTDQADNVTTRSVSYTVAVAVPAPRADFICSPISGDAPLEVKFVNKSTGEIASCEWNFGDGSSSTEFAPVHTYDVAGRYEVILLVEGPGGSSTDEFCCIKVMEPEVSLVPLRIAFEDGSVETTVKSIWDGPGIYCSGPSRHGMWLLISKTTGDELFRGTEDGLFSGLKLGLGHPVQVLLAGPEILPEGYVFDSCLLDAAFYQWPEFVSCGSTVYLQAISGPIPAFDYNLRVSNIITLHIRPCD
jgi:hypothetical protein